MNINRVLSVEPQIGPRSESLVSLVKSRIMLFARLTSRIGSRLMAELLPKNSAWMSLNSLMILLLQDSK